MDELQKLRKAIEEHRSQKADDRCIEDDDRLYEALEDGIKCDRRVGSKVEMLHNCQRFIENRCQSGGWKTYQELEKENTDLIDTIAAIYTKLGLSEGNTQGDILVSDTIVNALKKKVLIESITENSGRRWGRDREITKVYVDGQLIGRGDYQGEPEDNCRSRDYHWVEDLLGRLAKNLGAEVEVKEIQKNEQGEDIDPEDEIYEN